MTASQVRKILIVTKYRFIGDSLLAVPTIRAAAREWPNAVITLLTGARAHELLQNCPYVSDVIEFDPYRPADQGLTRFFSLVADIHGRKFDLALVLNRSFHSALTCTLGGARIRASWGGFHWRDWMLSKQCPYRTDRPEIDSYLDIVRSVTGAIDQPYDRSLAVWLSSEERCNLPHPVLERPRLIGIQPGATHGYKRWPADRFAQVCSELLASGQASHIVLIGGPDEVGAADETVSCFASPMRSKLTSLVGQLSLRQTLVALSRLDLFLAGDTAIRHAAVALNTPTVVLFGRTNFAKWGNPVPMRHIVIHPESDEMTDISVAEVTSAVSGVLGATRANASELAVATKAG